MTPTSPREQIVRSGLLLLTATIWGTGFVAQALGMEHIGPFAFTWARSMIGGLFLLLLLPLLDRLQNRRAPRAQESAWRNPVLWKGGFFCGTLLFLGESLQQFGLLETEVGKAGFLTSLNILLVPLGACFLGRRPGANVWVAVALALAGLWLLCVQGDLSVGRGDLLVIACAAAFTLHILTIDHFAPQVDCVRMSCLQFFVGGCWGGVLMTLFEPPTTDGLIASLPCILYAGVLSNGIAYTLQVVGQKGMNPTVAALIMSLESVVSVIAGWLIMDQVLSGRELLGCFVMGTAVVLAIVPPRMYLRHLRARRTAS